MALTPAQEQYLKGLGIGKGAGRGGAISGVGKGAAVGTTIAPGIGTAIGGIVGGIGGWLKGRGASKKAKAEARAKLEQDAAIFNKGEDERIARFSAGQSLLQGLQGRGFTNIDPETAAKLGTAREYDPATAGLSNPFAGAGSAAVGGLIDSAMDIAGQYGMNRGGGGSSSDVFRTGGDSVGGPQGSFQDVMGGSGEGIGPRGVSLDDLKNLYKLGGSGTANFG
jgi:hypothetical protein